MLLACAELHSFVKGEVGTIAERFAACKAATHRLVGPLQRCPAPQALVLHGGSILPIETVHCLMQVGAGEGSSAGISGRVKRLEEKIPELQIKLRKHIKHTHGAAEGGSSKSLNGRVEVLEEAVDALLEAQVRLTLLCRAAQTEGFSCLV